MKVSRYPLSIGFTGPIKTPRRTSHLIHSLVPDLEEFKKMINERSKPSEKGGKGKLGDYEKKWIGLAESVLSSQNLILATPPDSKKITEWCVRFPHCRSLVTTVENMLELSRCSRGPLRLPPILLAGPPGVGKTAVALELAKVLGVPSYYRQHGAGDGRICFERSIACLGQWEIRRGARSSFTGNGEPGDGSG